LRFVKENARKVQSHISCNYRKAPVVLCQIGGTLSANQLYTPVILAASLIPFLTYNVLSGKIDTPGTKTLP
jgi:hypothetical protein